MAMSAESRRGAGSLCEMIRAKRYMPREDMVGSWDMGLEFIVDD